MDGLMYLIGEKGRLIHHTTSHFESGVTTCHCSIGWVIMSKLVGNEWKVLLLVYTQSKQLSSLEINKWIKIKKLEFTVQVFHYGRKHSTLFTISLDSEVRPGAFEKQWNGEWIMSHSIVLIYGSTSTKIDCAFAGGYLVQFLSNPSLINWKEVLKNF